MLTNNKRNYGIDLLRLISMYMVVILHILGNGGILGKLHWGGQFAIAWLLEIGAYCAVDCYALISGFVCYKEDKRTNNYSRYIILWMQVFFYCVLISLVFYLFYPEVVSKKHLIFALFPVTFNQYWYFTSYTGIAIIAPFLNRIVQDIMDRKILRKFTFGITAAVFYVAAAGGFGRDPFRLESGYSFLWLTILYIIGAYIKKFSLHEKFSKRHILLIGEVLIILTWGWKLGIGRLTNCLLGVTIADDILISYTSPTILGAALASLFYFAQVSPSIFMKKCISIMAPAAFGVYLIHTHPLVFQYILKGAFKEAAELYAWIIPFAVCGIALVIFTACIMIDKLRASIFKLLRLQKLAENIEKMGRRIIQRIYEKMELIEGMKKSL